MTKRLQQLNQGENGVIQKLHIEPGQDHLARRLHATGFRMGKSIKLLRKAFLGGPLHIQIGTTEVMLRPSEAQFIEICCS